MTHRWPQRYSFALFLNLFAATALLMGGLMQAESPFVDTLMPQPAHVQPVDGPVHTVDATFCIALPSKSSALLQRVAQRATQRLALTTALPLPLACSPSASPAVTVQVDVRTPEPLSIATDESYSLDSTVYPAVLHARSAYGAMRGFETLVQLVQQQGTGYVLPAVRIDDAPRFHWRGLMLDCGRHFLPIAVIYRTLDGMAAVKMNVLHWHLTEDQGFRVESLRFPRLQKMGSNGQFYTQQQVREIVAYAADRGIRVVPEFDMPGHATSWLVGYPEIASGPGPYHLEHTFGIHDATMDPTNERTYKFLDAFLGEMAGLFPDEYIHIGGDETTGKEWLANPHIRSFMEQHSLKDPAALQAYFNVRVQKILAAHGKRMIGWDETLTADLPAQAAIQNWHGTNLLIGSAKAGHSTVYSGSNPLYLDHMYTAEHMYASDPLPEDGGLNAEQEALILGGETCMWSEQVDAQTVDSRIWPRSAAVAERLWSPRNVRDIDDMYRRLWITSQRLAALGLTQFSGPDAGLRELASTSDDSALRTLASVVQPVPFDRRYSMQHTSADTQLDRFIDFTTPDPPVRHGFQTLVAAYLRDRTTKPAQAAMETRELNALFLHWSAAAEALTTLPQQSPKLAEVKPRAEQLHRLALLGGEAIKHLQENSRPPEEWQSRSNAALKQAALHDAMVDFVILDPLRDLITAAERNAE